VRNECEWIVYLEIFESPKGITNMKWDGEM
jgi:hypothetical protein